MDATVVHDGQCDEFDIVTVTHPTEDTASLMTENTRAPVVTKCGCVHASLHMHIVVLFRITRTMASLVLGYRMGDAV